MSPLRVYTLSLFNPHVLALVGLTQLYRPTHPKKIYYTSTQYTISMTIPHYNNNRINAFSLYQLWHHLSGLRILFVVIKFTNLHDLSLHWERAAS